MESDDGTEMPEPLCRFCSPLLISLGVIAANASLVPEYWQTHPPLFLPVFYSLPFPRLIDLNNNSSSPAYVPFPGSTITIISVVVLGDIPFSRF